MAYYVTTALGREVRLDDWMSRHSDTIVRVLYDFALNPLNDGTLGLQFAALANATGLDLQDVSMLVKHLIAQGLIRNTHKGYQITDLGMQLVHKAPGVVHW